MPLDPLKVSAVMSSGLSSVCATCSKYWEARERGVPGDTCTAKDCGGPISGREFPEYDGPISDFSRWCFACGGDPKYIIRLSGKQRMFGVCEQHCKLLTTMVTPKTNLDPSHTELLSAQGAIGLEDLTKPPKKSLARAIYEAETYFEEQAKAGKKA